MRKAAVVVAAVLALLAAYSLIEPYLILVNRVDFADDRLPESFDGKRIVFVSDIHCGPLFSIGRTRELVDSIDGLEPDMILLGGDYISSDDIFNTGDRIGPCLGEFSRLKAPLGAYAVLGNHENWAGRDRAMNSLESASIRVIDNDGVWASSGNGSIRIAGVADLWTQRQDFNAALDGAKASDYTILLSHNPDIAEYLRSDSIALVLSGHTHGGQVTLFGLWTPYLPSNAGQKYAGGFVKTNHTTVFVTKGVGTTGLPMRFFARPEIVVLTLHRE
ncbi:MAG: metallophosphoesterase [Candidatus Altiarchaeota archaeon]